MTKEERNAKLEEAKQLLLAGWCQGKLAADISGARVPAEHESAVYFCLEGAMIKVSGTPYWSYLWTAVRLAAKAANIATQDELIEWQDTPGRTKYEVAALFDQAKEQPL